MVADDKLKRDGEVPAWRSLTGRTFSDSLAPSFPLVILPDRRLPSLHPEEWLSERIANIAEFDPHYEASWYGPYNALLSHYFPYQQRFLVKPQPRIRQPFLEPTETSFSSDQADSSQIADVPLDAADFAADLSMTSMGGFAMPGGFSTIPDFIVTKATQFTTQDQPLLLVEVKTRDPGRESTLRTYKYQAYRYMASLAEQTVNAKLIGLMICSSEVTVFRVEDTGSAILMDGEIHDVNSTTIRRLLLDIAEENWA